MDAKIAVLVLCNIVPVMVVILCGAVQRCGAQLHVARRKAQKQGIINDLISEERTLL